ncbi:MAG TPA: ABC transporter ATP-binding protein, partial [Acidimicrobiaceae bacterium]|nr:ABC transporter ATP-binding protein [Acidimicrobiaceae bacterium]
MSDLPPPPPTGPPSQPPPPTGEPVRQIARLVDGGEVMVEAIGVTKSFGDVVAVSDVTFQIGSGITAILGPNGAGK